MKEQKIQEITSSVLGTLGVTVSVQDLTQVINLIILILSLVNILWVLGSKVYQRIKNKDYENVPQDVNEAIEDIKKLKEKDGK